MKVVEICCVWHADAVGIHSRKLFLKSLRGGEHEVTLSDQPCFAGQHGIRVGGEAGVVVHAVVDHFPAEALAQFQSHGCPERQLNQADGVKDVISTAKFLECH